MKLKKNILVSPLNWGIGHATRCIPIIKKLQEHNFNVIIASSGRSLDLLIQEFPNLDFIKINDYNIKYYSSLPMTISMLIQIPKILFNIQKENNQLKGIINDFKIDGIISDKSLTSIRDDFSYKVCPYKVMIHDLRLYIDSNNYVHRKY